VFDDRTLREVASDVRSGRIRWDEARDESVRRIAALDAQLGAFVAVPDASMSRVPDGPLAGAPIAVKDNIATQGVTTTCGSRILGNWVPPYDATAVKRIRDAGAVVVGKTNMDEFGMGSSTEFSAFGPTLNPHDPARVPGGSSGGSAAAVAAGLVPAALGSDTGGSVRQPAAHCGIVGVKPTYGTVSRYGLVAYASSLEQVGVLAARVHDAALLLEVIAGPDAADATSVGGTLDEPTPEGLRVGLVAEMLGPGVEPDVKAAVLRAGEQLAGAGASVDTVSIPSVDSALSAYYVIAPAEASANLARFDGVRYGLGAGETAATRTAGFGEEVKRRIMLGAFALSAGYYDAYYGRAMQVRTLVIRDFRRAFGECDVLLAPTSPCTAFRFGELIDDPVQLYLTDICTVTANLAGIPAMSVPWGVDGNGLPIGVQVLAPHFGERTMFRAAAALEALAPPLPRPRLHAVA
jgi:aspartyl-tRNA(Asn)/glutamyl-tRNA(Gln) amidotransferase subunit A